MKFHNNLRNLFWEILIINYIREVVISAMNMCWFLLSCSFLISAFKLCRLWIKASCHFSCFSLWILGSFSSNDIITTSCINIFELETEGLVCLHGAIFSCALWAIFRIFLDISTSGGIDTRWYLRDIGIFGFPMEFIREMVKAW